MKAIGFYKPLPINDVDSPADATCTTLVATGAQAGKPYMSPRAIRT